MKPLVILDARGVFLHMYYRDKDPDGLLKADGSIANTAGFGISNFIDGTLKQVLETTAPVNVIAVWDGGNDKRRMIHDKYKANRKKIEKDPVETEQIDLLMQYAKRFLAYLGCTNVSVPGVEADDVIALLCQSFSDRAIDLYTVDADLTQLASDNVLVYLKNDVVMDEYKGIPLDLIALNKSIVGDTSDNYGGVPRMGAAAWEKLVDLVGFDGMKELDQCVKAGKWGRLLHLRDETGDKGLAKLYDERDTWKKMYTLASLHPEWCYGWKGKKKIQPVWYKRVPVAEKLKQTLEACGCRYHWATLKPFTTTTTLVTDDNLDDAFDHLNEHLPRTEFVATDFESYDTLKHPAFKEAMKGKKGDYVDVLSQKVTGASFTYGDNLQHTLYVSTYHKDTNNVSRADLAAIFREIQDELKLPLVAHNAAFEEQVAKQCLGFQFDEPEDTMIMASYVNEEEPAGLKDLSLRHLGYKQESFKDTLATEGAEDMSQMTGAGVLKYGADDALVTAHLRVLFHTIMVVEGTWKFYHEYNRAPVHVLNRRKETGTAVDMGKMKELQRADSETVTKLMAGIREALESHCLEEKPEAAEALFQEERSNLVKILRAKKGSEWSEEKIQARVDEQRLRWIEASKYVPPQTIVETKPFTATLGQLNTVIADLGLQPKMEGNSRTKLEAWIEHQESDSEFLGKLIPAAHLLTAAKQKTKEKWTEDDAQAFDNFVNYCQPILDKKAKAVTVGDELNLNSPPQMAELLYCKLGLPLRSRTRPQKDSIRDSLGLEGSPGTDEEAIAIAIAQDCGPDDWRRQILRDVKEIKACLTRESLYYSKYPLWVHPKTNCIHPGIRDCGTKTRRPTGGAPNILQIAKAPLRSMFVPRFDDHCLVAIDFSGQELRVTGSEAKDPTMIDAYTSMGTYVDEYGMTRSKFKDLHSVTAAGFAAEILTIEFGKEVLQDFTLVNGSLTYEEFKAIIDGAVTVDQAVAKIIKDVRGMAKAVNFLICYCGTPLTLAKRLGVPVEFAEKLMAMVFALYCRLQPWQQEVIEQANRLGYVTTAYGNRKHVPLDLKSSQRGLRGAVERPTVNYCIQGTAADILHIMETKMHRTRLMEETGAVMVAPIYDEVLASVPVKNVFEYCERMQDIMNVTPPGHAIPQLAEVSVGWNWWEKVELGDRPAEVKLLKALGVEGKRLRV